MKINFMLLKERPILSMFLIFVLIASCTSPALQIKEISSKSDKETGTNPAPPISASLTTIPDFGEEVLDGYKSIEELEKDIQTAGLLFLKQKIKEYKNQKEPCYYSASAETLETSTLEKSNTNPDGYKTNNQVESVDEADVVKSDGKYIYAVYGTELIVFDLSTDIVDRKSIFTNRYGKKEILLKNNKIAALCSNYYSSNRTTEIVVLDIENGKLKKETSKEINGNYITAREINGNIHIITSANFNYYLLDQKIFRWDCNTEYENMSDEEYEKAAWEKGKKYLPKWSKSLINSILADKNGNISINSLKNVARISIQKNINKQEKDADATEDKINHPSITCFPEIDSFIKISSFNIESNLSDIKTAGVFSKGYSSDNIYASNDIIVVTNAGWTYQGWWNWSTSTFLTAFSLTENGEATLKSIGMVDGYVNNQFSLDYYEGYLRVATTIGSQWEFINNTWQEASSSESFINVLDLSDKTMKIVGTVDKLGLTERIYSVRYIGDKAFVVTFRQTDPFYTIDLSDPYNPFVAGELKIPGFSSYLHPVNDNYIIGVGQDATEEGRVTGVKITLFDVSDPGNPKDVYNNVITGSNDSEVGWDHHAFRYLKPETIGSKNGAIIIPFRSYGYSITNKIDGFMVYELSLDDGIKLRGEINHNPYLYNNYDFYYKDYFKARSMYFGNNRLITLKKSSIMLTNFSTLELQKLNELEYNYKPIKADVINY